MCGIFTVFDPKGVSQNLSYHLVGVRALAHRGPDDEGTYLDDSVFVGHRRLSILDLSPAGHQPMLGADGQVVLAFNGQIYNHPELRDELTAKGYQFRSNCDTETLLNMYLEYGLDAFARMRGMWAVTIWDRRDGTLIASRDRMGVKPLYLYEAGSELVLASEIKAVLASRPEAGKIDDLSLRRYITRGWLDHDARTMFSRIRQLPPASVTVWRGQGRVEQRIFWRPPVPHARRHDPADIRDGFIDTVERHLQSDAPVATTLSGGLDSSSITCGLARALGRADRVHAFSIRPPDTPDESPWIDDTVAWTGIDHDYLDPEDIDIVDALDDLIERMDEPVFNSAYVYQALLRKFVSRRGYKVLLVGDGGDEVFGGYAKMLPMFQTALLRDGKRHAARRAIRGGQSLSGRTPAEQIARLKLYRDHGIGARTCQEFRRGYDLFSDDVELDDEELFPAFDHPQLEDEIEGCAFFRELLDRIRLDIPHHLRNEDRNSMAYGLEARPAFVDHELIELAWEFPYELFMENGINKRLMRRAMEGTVTPSVLSLEKKFVRPGNNTVLAYDQLAEPLQDMLHGGGGLTDGLWRDDLYKVYAQDRKDCNVDNAYPWFRFYMTQRWMKLKASAQPQPAAVSPVRMVQ